MASFDGSSSLPHVREIHRMPCPDWTRHAMNFAGMSVGLAQEEQEQELLITTVWIARSTSAVTAKITMAILLEQGTTLSCPAVRCQPLSVQHIVQAVECIVCIVLATKVIRSCSIAKTTAISSATPAKLSTTTNTRQ